MGLIRDWRRIASFAVLAAAFVALSGCKTDEGIIGGDTGYVFIRRACDELHAYNYLLGSSTDPNTGEVYYWHERLPDTPLPAPSYVLELMIGADSGVFGRPDMGNILPPDASIESQLEKKHFGRRTKSYDDSERYYMNLRFVEYRTDAVEDIKLYADKDIFGRAVGTNIGDLFEIIILPERYNGFMFSESGRYIGEIENGTSIRDYLRQRPMMAASMSLRLKSVPAELPQTLVFTVEVTMASGETISSSTSEISLTQ